ncbi:MAG: agmatine deiminase family protein [Fodinibius sp.]|nr:agmatine deiminase family protein [Fodinibius sp.]
MADLTSHSRNFRMPAEWHSHAATQLHWPSNRATWPGKRLQEVETVYLNVIEVLSDFEPIHLLVENKEVADRAERLMDNRGFDTTAITIHLRAINDVWARDCGPIFVKRIEGEGEAFAITDWEYNAWGGKYPPFGDDNSLPRYFASTYNIPRFEPGMVLEGGSIDTNGQGLLLTTESVLLNENRNPELSKRQIEKKLEKYLGITKIIWLKDGLAGDDTDGHIDDIARFVREDTILATVTDDPDDINYPALQENLQILKQAADQHDQKLTIETLPLPRTKIPSTTVDGSEYVPASYVNFYIANGVVLVPLYDERYDQQAVDLLSSYFPDRQVVGISCADLVWGQGSIHCITQQLYGI